MGILVGGFFIVFGVIWVAFTLGMFLFLKSQGVTDNGMGTLFSGIGGIFILIGVPMVISGVINNRKRQAEENKVMTQGVATTGKVTFVDKNYSLLVNEKPIYSIVEFQFKDGSGQLRTSRKENVDSDLVIRTQMAVGNEVNLKYLLENPDENVLILTHPQTGEQSVSI